MIKLNVSGSGNVSVSSQAELDEALATFVSQVSEAILIDGRKYDLYFSFSASEPYAYDGVDGDDDRRLFD